MKTPAGDLVWMQGWDKHAPQRGTVALPGITPLWISPNQEGGA